jgi:hypothetical protein
MTTGAEPSVTQAAEILMQLDKAEPAQTEKEKLQHKRDAFLDRTSSALTRTSHSIDSIE